MVFGGGPIEKKGPGGTQPSCEGQVQALWNIEVNSKTSGPEGGNYPEKGGLHSCNPLKDLPGTFWTTPVGVKKRRGQKKKPLEEKNDAWPATSEIQSKTRGKKKGVSGKGADSSCNGQKGSEVKTGQTKKTKGGGREV